MSAVGHLKLRNMLRRYLTRRTAANTDSERQVALAFPKEGRGSKDHLAFIQGCLACQKTPADARQLKSTQSNKLGHKVSDATSDRTPISG